MKKILLSLVAVAALMAGSNSWGADLSAVGTNGVELTTDYSYTRTQDTPYYLSVHDLVAGIQLNHGKLGSAALEVGDHQVVTAYRNNFTAFRITYLNGFALPGHVLNFAASGSYGVSTGDVWVPVVNGKNNNSNLQDFTGVGEFTAHVISYDSGVKLFADYSYTHEWVDTVVDGNAQRAVGGVYLSGKHLVAKIGYGYQWASTGVDSQVGVASLSYKF